MNFSTFSEQEYERWSYLRAIEWGEWPLFIFQPVAPFLLLFFEYWQIIIVILIFDWLWAFFVKYKYINIELLNFGSLFVHLKWPFSVIMGVYFLSSRLYLIGLIALFWPLITLILIFLTPFTKIGKIQEEIIKKIRPY